MIVVKEKLSPLQYKILQEYIKNGGDGTAAWMAVKPGQSKGYVYNASSRLVNSAAFQEALGEATKAVAVKTEVTKTSLLRDAARITGKAEDVEQYTAALKGVDTQARLIGAFDLDEDGAEMYARLINKVSIKNITINNTQINNELKESDMQVIGES